MTADDDFFGETPNPVEKGLTRYHRNDSNDVVLMVHSFFFPGDHGSWSGGCFGDSSPGVRLGVEGRQVFGLVAQGWA